MIFNQKEAFITYPSSIPIDTVKQIEDSPAIESVDLVRSGMLGNVFRITINEDEI